MYHVMRAVLGHEAGASGDQALAVLISPATPPVTTTMAAAKANFAALAKLVADVLASDGDKVLALLLGECPAVCAVFLGLAWNDDVSSCGWPNEGLFSSPVDDRCWIEETMPPFIIASTWNHRLVTSVPVITSEPLNLRAGSFHGSGLVSSREGSMLSNPLCLAIQNHHMIMRDAVVEDSGNFDHLRFFNVHPNLSTRAYDISAFIGNAATAAGI
ncbi:hypothetical protein HPB51_007767 [Rhipicephalus microplus]|uniref:Uncharacterized protein n=1 Tax=Rhipicephalus microplus TaxID=6941 RepID=A0A9J6ENI4_RHIMP|nr:hypothetical protein HPB51_007767 [Rhipicephalus microplus]